MQFIIMLGVYLISTICFIAYQHTALFTADLTWLMHCTHLLLAGQSNYYEYFETNPPLILILNIPAVMLGNLFHLSDGTAFLSELFFFVTLILCQLFFLLKRYFVDRMWLITFLSAIFCIIFIAMPLSVFGERDFIALLLTLPYLLVTALRLTHKPVYFLEAALIALVAAIGFSLKPYFLFSLIFVEVFYLFKVRSIKRYIRTEPCVILGSMILYVTAILYFSPHYFHLIMPLVRVLYMPVFCVVPWPERIFTVSSIAVLIAIFLLMYSAFLEKKDIFIQLLLLFTLGFYAAYWVAGQAWYYHIYPALALSFVGVSYLWFIYLPRCFALNPLCRALTVYQKTFTFLLLSLGVAFFCSLTLEIAGLISAAIARNANYFYTTPARYLQAQKNIHTTLVISGWFDQQRLDDLTHKKATSRFPSLLLIPGLTVLQLNGRVDEYQKLRHLFFTLYMQDIAKNPPQAIIFYDQRYCVYDDQDKNKHCFSYRAFLEKNQRFAQFFSQYHRVKHWGVVTMYRLCATKKI